MTWLVYINSLNYFYLIGLIFIYLITQFTFSFFIQSNFYLNAVNSLPNHQNMIAITFDDGPEENITPAVLDLLKKYNARATFFCIGTKIMGNEHIIQRIYKEGHLIGNHTYYHSNAFGFLTTKRIMEEIVATDELISEITGEKIKFFRPPFGITNPNVVNATQKLGLMVIGWNKRTYDGYLRDKEKILRNAKRNLRSGDIVLFHDNHPQIIEILEVFLKHMNELGLNSERVDKLMA